MMIEPHQDTSDNSHFDLSPQLGKNLEHVEPDRTSITPTEPMQLKHSEQLLAHLPLSLPVPIQANQLSGAQPVGHPELLRSNQHAADQHPAAVYLARLAPGSRRTMSTSLGLIAGLLTSYRCDIQTLDWGALRYQHTAAVRALLADLYAPATANKMLAALRGVLKEAWRLGQMSAEEHARASDLAGVRGHTVPAGRELTAGEIAALLSACERDISPAGLRDGAIIATMYAAGLRREEIVALDLGDYNADTGRLVVRGKGNKERTAYLEGGAALAIADWLNVRRSAAVAGEATRAVDTVGSVHSHATGTEVLGALFWPVNKGGKLVKRRLTTQAIYNILHKRAMEAGIKEFSPHDLRRTFVSDLLDAGADIATVAKMAGHSNVQTTARYDRRPEEAKRRAARLLHVPYHHRDRKGKED